MIDVIECLKKRIEYPLYSGEDLWLQEVIAEPTQSCIAIILQEGYLWHAKEQEQVKQFCSKYHIAGEISLGRPYVSSELHFSLIIGTAERPHKYRTSLFKGLPYRERTMVGIASKLVLPNKYSESFKLYATRVKEWFNSGTIPEDDVEGRFEFCETDAPDTSGALYYPALKKKKKRQIKQLLENEDVIRLGDVAEITTANIISD